MKASASAAVYVVSRCSVPRCTATRRAAARSGELSVPTAKVCSRSPRSASISRCDRGDEARVQAAGEEHADGHVAHELALDRPDEDVAGPAQRLGRGGRAGTAWARHPRQAVGDGAGEAQQAVLRASTRSRAGTARRARCHSARTPPSPRRSACGPPRWAQYSGLMPTGSRAATKRPSAAAMTNANIPFELGEAASARAPRAAAARPRCRSRSRTLLAAQARADLGVVVDLAVADEPDVLALVDERLAPAADVDDRQARVWPSQLPPTSTQPLSSGPRWTSLLQHPLERRPVRSCRARQRFRTCQAATRRERGLTAGRSRRRPPSRSPRRPRRRARRRQ